MDIMSEPVITADGQTYEKKAIECWLREHNTSPLTNMALPHTHLTPNFALKKLIGDYLDGIHK